MRRTDGLVRMAPNLGWRDEPLGVRLADALGVDVPVLVANEADLGGLAEHRRGAAVGAASVVYVMGEVGVGGNVIVENTPLVGAAGYAGEIGHMAVNPDGATCGCGSVGCWETEVGEGALLLRAGRDPEGGRAAIDALLDDAIAGDPAARAGLDHVARWLGIGLATLVNVFDPERIVLGGLFERIHPLIGAALDRELDTRALPASRELVRVVPGALGVDGPLIGAAEHAFEPMLADPAVRLEAIRRRPLRASA